MFHKIQDAKAAIISSLFMQRTTMPTHGCCEQMLGRLMVSLLVIRWEFSREVEPAFLRLTGEGSIAELLTSEKLLKLYEIVECS